MSAEERERPSHGPGERVFTGGRAKPPSTRVKTAPADPIGSLRFEPEAASQSKELAELTARPAAAESSLSFEPEGGGPAERAGDGEPVGKKTPEPHPQDDAEIASLIELAANVERDTTAGTRREQVFTPGPARADLSGDIEAEFFGPKRAPVPRAPARRKKEPEGRDGRPPDSSADAGPSGAKGRPDDAAPVGTGTPSVSRGWSSVFLSDAVIGEKRRKDTTSLMRATRSLPAAADRAFQRWTGRFTKAVGRIDSALRRVRLSLSGLFATAVIVSVALNIGLPMPWAGGIAAICLLLTLAGQPARNLIGYAGIIMGSAAIAEIIRQRERFHEIFQMFFS